MTVTRKVRKIVATKKRFTENWFEVLKPYISYYTYIKKTNLKVSSRNNKLIFI